MKVIFCSSAFIRNKKSQILIMSRRKKESFRDCWEFPGGKLNNYETYLEALVRELKEELNIRINIKELVNYSFFKHQYRSFLLMMYVFEVKNWSGKICNNESEKLEWVSIGRLRRKKLLPANIKVIDYFLK